MTTMTPARRAQLEELKRKRRQARDQNKRTPHQADVSHRQFAAELQRQAMGNVAPTMQRFDLCRPATWPTAAEFCARFGQTWAELCAEVGLRERVTA